MTDPEILAALKRSLDADPRNGPLWLHYADLLRGAGRTADAIAALRLALEIPATRDSANRRLVPLLREAGQLAEALIRIEALLESSADPELRAEHARILAARGDDARETADVEPRGPALAATQPETVDPEDWAAQFDWGDLHVTFADVAGLDEVKRQIELKIIAPFRQPEIYRAFGRSGGGGILLYGPPGCGKTFVARATAGEVGARFVSVSIHEVVDKYWGESEKLIHALFEEARRKSPTVLFFDEFDALGATRGRSEATFWKTLVDQLLQEMDGLVGRNTDILLCAATNTPWNVDPAFRRPGRFDRVVFVPPPDQEAREQIVERSLRRVPGGDVIDTRKVAKQTALFTGADLVSLCERAAERALESSLRTGEVHEITDHDFARELPKMQSSALEWLATARNYAKYSNEGGQYDELTAFLRAHKKW